LDFLGEVLRPDQVSDSEDVRQDHAHDFGLNTEGVPPEAVVFPESTEDVVHVLVEASDREIPVTPYALGTGLEGMAVPSSDGISLDMTRMDAISSFHPEDFQVTVQPGVVGSDINDEVKSRGLFFPPLPTSGDISTIGGMIANDASGKYTVRYGEVQDWLLELEVVLPDGSVVRAGSRARKSSSGYNLKDLFVGSEGTLGVITEAILELAGLPDQRRRGRVLFSDFDDAGQCVRDLVQGGVDLAAVELVDELSVRMANQHLDLDLTEGPGLFLEFHADHDIEEEMEYAKTILRSHDPVEMTFAEDPKAMDELWTARRELAWAVASYREDLDPVQSGDVTVPISRFPELLRYIRGLGEDRDYLVPCFGHAGDGNIHYTVLVDKSDSEQVRKGEKLYEDVVHKALEMGGTATGEHGIGRGKRKFMESEHGPAGVNVMRRIKTALDPDNIMNPEAIFPDN
jgi:D-lactate dehydrogenase (cytochrome)